MQHSTDDWMGMGDTFADRLKLRQEIFQKIKKQVQLYLGPESEDIREYALAYKKVIEAKKWSLSNKEDLYHQIMTSQIVFGGDFHSFAQAQKVHLRILREIAPQRRVLLCLECVPSQFQAYLQQYMEDVISEEEFLVKVDWQQNWGFPWEHYKALFQEIKSHGGQCFGLNQVFKKKTAKNLLRRDDHAAEILKRLYFTKSSEDLLYVIYGDLHIAKDHLPTQFLDRIEESVKTVSIYLNPERIYFDLAKQNKSPEGVVLKFSDDEFCLLESPPWVKWQSYLLFLEENIDEVLEEEDRQLDYTEHVQSLMQLICADLNVPYEFDEQVYSFADHEFIDLVSEKLEEQDIQWVQGLIANDISFYYPEKHILYLSRATVNYAADLAGHVVHATLAKRKKIFWPKETYFLQNIWLETVAFFLSKIVNPHRKAMNLKDLRKLLAAFSKDGGEEPLRLALDQKMQELVEVYGEHHDPIERPPIKDPMSYAKAAKILGAYHGDRLFRLFRSRRLSRKMLMIWLKHDVEGGEFFKFYYQVLRELDNIELGVSYEQ